MTTMAQVDKKNQENLKKVASGGKIAYQYGRTSNGQYVVLIGAGHAPDIVAMFAKGGGDAGTIEVLREQIKGKGEVKVSGCKSNKAQFEEALGRVTKKKVIHV